MTGAVWYRHWVEIRGGLLVASALVGLFVLLYPLFIVVSSARFSQSGEVVNELAQFAQMLPALGPERFFQWSWHAWICGLAAWCIGLFLAGTGIRTNSLTPLHPSHVYTLTLPVSRTTLLWTRFATSCAAIVLLFAAMLIVHVAVLAILELEAPLAPMAAASALAAALLIGVVAVSGLVMMWDDRLMGIAVPVAVVVAVLYGWALTARYLASQTVPVAGLMWIAAVTMAALWLSTVVARRRDF